MPRKALPPLPVNIETYRFDFGSGSYPVWFSPDVKEGSQISPIYPHSHPAPEFIEMTEGRLEAALDGEKFTLNAGDILLVSPYATHSAKFDTDKAHGVFEYRYMIFELSVFADCGKRVADIIDDLRRGKARFRPVISGDSAKAPSLRELDRELLDPLLGDLVRRALHSLIRTHLIREKHHERFA